MQRSLVWMICFGLLCSASGAWAQSAVNSWQGRDKSDLIQKFSRPQYVVPDARGGQVFVYLPVDSRTNVAPTAHISPVRPLADLQTLTAYRVFFINKEGKIDRVESKGSAFNWNPPWW